MRQGFRIFAPILGLMLSPLCPIRTAQAGIVLYSDTTTYSGSYYAAGGAVTDPSGNLSTAMVANQINFAAGSGGAAINSVSFSVVNANSAAVTADVDLRFYTVGSNGLPGTLLGGLDFNPISFTADSLTVYTYSPGSTIFTVPTNGEIYVGEYYDNDLAASNATTATQLNNLGVGIYGPPTVGSSPDYFYQTPGGSTNTASNPGGSLLYFGGTPVANFGFAFSGTPLAVPEPASVLLSVCGGVLALAGSSLRKALRRKAA